MKLQTKLNLATGLILFVTLTTMISVDMLHDRDIYFESQKNLMSRSAEVLRNMLARAQNAEEMASIVRDLAPILQDPGDNSTYIVVSDHKDRILASTLHAATGRLLTELPLPKIAPSEQSRLQTFISFHRNPEVHVFTPFPLQPAVTGEKYPVRGRIFISHSLETEYRHFLTEFSVMGLYAALLLGFLLALFTYFFHHFITAPVNTLISGLHKVEEGAWETSVSVEHKDEIGTLSEAFNRMAHQLHSTVEHMLRVEKMTTLGEMAARVAHEIRNPLVPIGGLANNLAQKMAEGSRERAHLEMIVREVKRLEKILESILIFTKETAPTFADNDINKIITEALRIVELYVERGNIAIQANLAPDLPPVSCDANQLEQVLVNLFYNSVQAMEGTGGALKVVSSYLPERRKVSIEVNDTGGGISDKDIHRIFDPFFTTKESGTGLGLTIAHQIVTSHQGDLMVHNHPGEGVTFIIELPLKQQLVERRTLHPHAARGKIKT